MMAFPEHITKSFMEAVNPVIDKLTGFEDRLGKIELFLRYTTLPVLQEFDLASV